MSIELNLQTTNKMTQKDFLVQVVQWKKSILSYWNKKEIILSKSEHLPVTK